MSCLGTDVACESSLFTGFGIVQTQCHVSLDYGYFSLNLQEDYAFFPVLLAHIGPVTILI